MVGDMTALRRGKEFYELQIPDNRTILVFPNKTTSTLDSSIEPLPTRQAVTTREIPW